jgi:hypothetical protein
MATPTIAITTRITAAYWRSLEVSSVINSIPPAHLYQSIPVLDHTMAVQITGFKQCRKFRMQANPMANSARFSRVVNSVSLLSMRLG